MKNTLMQYKGGGYDGCIWEWNYCYWDSEGKWHNLVASGYAGLKTEEKAKQFIADEIKAEEDFIINKFNAKYHLSRNPEYFLIDLTNADQMEEFKEGSAITNVIGIMRKLIKSPHLTDEVKVNMEIKCDLCHCKNDPDEIIPEPNNYHGDGGVGIEYEGKICLECCNMYSCSYCGEYYGKDYEEFDGEGECENCSAKGRKERWKGSHFKEDTEGAVAKYLPGLNFHRGLKNRFINWWANQGNHYLPNAWLSAYRDYIEEMGSIQEQSEMEYYFKNIYSKKNKD
jgi:hypothetical protein